MLPIALVFLVAQSVFAAPSVDVNFYELNSIPSTPDNGRLVNGYITDGPLEYLDGGDSPLYFQMIVPAIRDLANSRDSASQAAAVLQTIVSIGELANGVPGDACETAALNNAYASGNRGAVRSALAGFVQRITGYIDTISQLVVNPNSVRYSSGPRGNCVGGGRSYRFEEVWDGILSGANVNNINLLNEEYCASKRLYNAFNIRSNNLASAVTAASGKEANQIAQIALKPLAEFLRSVTKGGNPAPAGAAAKSALYKALSQI